MTGVGLAWHGMAWLKVRVCVCVCMCYVLHKQAKNQHFPAIYFSKHICCVSSLLLRSLAVLPFFYSLKVDRNICICICILMSPAYSVTQAYTARNARERERDREGEREISLINYVHHIKYILFASCVVWSQQILSAIRVHTLCTEEVNFIVLNSLLTWNLWDSFSFSFFFVAIFHRVSSFLCSSVFAIGARTLKRNSWDVWVLVFAVWLMLPIYFNCFRCFIFIISLFFVQNFTRQLSFAPKTKTERATASEMWKWKEPI